MRAILLLLLVLLSPLAQAQAPTPETAIPVEVPATPPPQPTQPRQEPPAPAPAAAPAAPASALSPEQATRLLGVLRNEQQRNDFIATLEALIASGRAAPQPETVLPLTPDSLGAQLLVGISERLSTMTDRISGAVQTVTDFSLLWRWVRGLSTDPVAQRRIADAAWKMAVVLGLGIALEWLVWRLLARTRDRLDAAAPENGSAFTWFKRLPLVMLRVLLDLVPVLAFAIISYGAISSVSPLPTTKLVLLAANNAYMASRIAMILARMLLSPNSSHLRLVPVTDETAAYITIWVRRIVLVVVFGYATAEAGLLFGLHPAAYDALLKILFLIVALLLVVVVLQNRQAIDGLIRAPEGSRGGVAILRNRIADVWHVIAVVYVIALWGVWALAIPDGFARLLRVSVATLVIGVGWRVASRFARGAIGRAFRVDGEMARRYPGLEARANRYLPLLKGVVSAMIAVVAILLLVEAWGFDAFGMFAQGSLGGRLVSALLSMGMSLLFALAVWEGVNTAINRHLAKLTRDAATARSARVRTLLPMLRTALMILLIVFGVLTVLSEIGFNIAPLLAGAGVIGLAIGFGSQRLVQDIITGLFLLLEDAMQVGDVVSLGGQSGTVEALSIRSIRLRALDGSVHIVPFSSVTTVTNQTRDFGYAVLDLAIPYAEDTDRVADLLRDIASEMRKEPRWERAVRADLEVMGVEKLNESNLTMRVRLMTDPPQRWAAAREMNRRIKRRFMEAGIPMAPGPSRMVLETAPPAAAPAPAAS